MLANDAWDEIMSVHMNHKAAIGKKESFTFLFGLKPRRKRRAICGKLKFIKNFVWRKQSGKKIGSIFEWNKKRNGEKIFVFL